MNQPRHPSCDTCGAMVPTSLMTFHVEWHAANDGHGARFFEETPEEQPSLEQLQSVIAALRAVPKVSARPEFVATLRERLTELPRRRSFNRRGSPKQTMSDLDAAVSPPLPITVITVCSSAVRTSAAE